MERLDQSGLNGPGDAVEDNRNGLRRARRGNRCAAAADPDGIRPLADELRRQGSKPICAIIGVSAFEDEILSLDPPEIPERGAKRSDPQVLGVGRRKQCQYPENFFCPGKPDCGTTRRGAPSAPSAANATRIRRRFIALRKPSQRELKVSLPRY